MLEKTHSAYLGAEGCVRHVRDTLYWPSIHHDIKYLCDNCSICQEAKPDQPRETMQSQPIPKRRWQIVSTDLFNVKKDGYLVVVDNLTKYWDLEQLNDTDAESTILQMKKIFARQGVPEVVITENSLQYASKEFKEFSESWNFHHYTSSPHHPKGNGTAEAALKQAKRILKMSHDPWMAILEQRNTPDELASPNEKLNSRRTRTVIPVKSELLEPHVIPTSSIIRASVKKKQQNKRYHNKKGKPPHPLVVGDSIRAKIRPQSSPLWTQGRVVIKESNGSYIVKADGREYRRNRCHIRKTREMTTPKVIATGPSLDSPVGPPTRSDAALPTSLQPKSIELPGVSNETGQMQLSDMKNKSKSEPVPIRKRRKKITETSQTKLKL